MLQRNRTDSQRAEGTESDPRPLGAHGVHHGLRNLETEARAVLDGPTVQVCASVASILRELVDEVAVRTVDLDAVEAGCDGVAGRLRVVGDKALDFGDG